MQKNYWPLTIIGIIAFGIVIICVGVVIAVKNPVSDELSYGDKKRVIDEKINDILLTQRAFEADSKVFLQTDFAKLPLKSAYEKNKNRLVTQSDFVDITNPSFSLIIQSSYTILSADADIEGFSSDIVPIHIQLCQNPPDSEVIVFRPCINFGVVKIGRYKMRFNIKYLDGDVLQKVYFEENVFIGDLPDGYQQNKSIYSY